MSQFLDIVAEQFGGSGQKYEHSFTTSYAAEYKSQMQGLILNYDIRTGTMIVKSDGTPEGDANLARVAARVSD